MLGQKSMLTQMCLSLVILNEDLRHVDGGQRTDRIVQNYDTYPKSQTDSSKSQVFLPHNSNFWFYLFLLKKLLLKVAVECTIASAIVYECCWFHWSWRVGYVRPHEDFSAPVFNFCTIIPRIFFSHSLWRCSSATITLIQPGLLDLYSAKAHRLCT